VGVGVGGVGIWWEWGGVGGVVVGWGEGGWGIAGKKS